MSLISFSFNGEYLAFCTADHRIKVWSSLQRKIKHELLIPDHLQKECTCLKWINSQEMNPVCLPFDKYI